MSYDNLRKFYYKINDKKKVRVVTINPSIPSPRAFISIEKFQNQAFNYRH
jgi:hypothetical protein